MKRPCKAPVNEFGGSHLDFSCEESEWASKVYSNNRWQKLVHFSPESWANFHLQVYSIKQSII